MMGAGVEVCGIVYPGRESNTSAAFFLSFMPLFPFPWSRLVCFLTPCLYFFFFLLL
jgi:hypothetical protein